MTIIKLFLSISFLVLFSCNNLKNESIAPNRIDTIPETAFWAGGLDGGNWYNVESIHSHKNNAIISIFNEQNGELIVSKRFFLICPADNLKLIENLSEQINYYDGERIGLLSTECYLK